MSREAIKDKNFRTIGYIETMSDGKQKAIDANFRTLGPTIQSATYMLRSSLWNECESDGIASYRSRYWD